MYKVIFLLIILNLLFCTKIYACPGIGPYYIELPDLVSELDFPSFDDYLYYVTKNNNIRSDIEGNIELGALSAESTDHIRVSIIFHNSKIPKSIKLYSVQDIRFTHENVNEKPLEEKLKIYRYIGEYKLYSDTINNLIVSINAFAMYEIDIYGISEYANGDTVITKMKQPIPKTSCMSPYVYYKK